MGDSLVLLSRRVELLRVKNQRKHMVDMVASTCLSCFGLWNDIVGAWLDHMLKLARLSVVFH